ncbi:MAG: bifunctional 3,4-dihydroxy-2-butanone 4-phosphate synthase/GTP cyclohydrolase II [Candidatus Buchananbacteria bacterium RIFCSPHIGHO2_01_FULL_44_11]|uniref:GTP cyclohydrolase-2 n=1 Tax=Candidatus Buchananbacteria bacterium RIFCSPHIGHO2_01_FULL_44_11 TaxID=1797535 RepID=A0A1G1Y339_9BACT|nr:MAG: bifunctional 3,4-dihydroxy-2-butanone 4-phosphate synthase/GTP cyclohydrolase II [Candidatus Buchananbacteria bacterium RIFCSPHIGHO2_01_FULL_44_11]
MKPFVSIKEAIKEIKLGRLLIVVDSPNRENEGDFFIPGQKVSADKTNFMITQGRGLLCVAIDLAIAGRLDLPLMVPAYQNQEKTQVNFTVSVNAAEGITSGVSAFDRTKTIQVLANPKSQAKDLVRPGHVLPLLASPGGLASRQGHTEAAIALSRLAGYSSCGVLCEIVKPDGRMARLPDLKKLAEEFDLKIVAISDLKKIIKPVLRPNKKLPTVVRTAAATMPNQFGQFKIMVYKSFFDNAEHTVLLYGQTKKRMLVRVHSSCLTGDTLGSRRCDCGPQLQESLRLIKQAGSGLILYLDQEGRGIGLSNKIKAYALQDKGLDTFEANEALGFGADLRGYKVAAQILQDLGVSEVNLLTNNPDKVKSLEKNGIKVVKRLPLEIKPDAINAKYLATKKNKMGHQLTSV